MVLASMAILVAIVYFCLYSFFIARRLLELRQLPHQKHKVNNLFVRMQVISDFQNNIIYMYIYIYSLLSNLFSLCHLH